MDNLMLIKWTDEERIKRLKRVLNSLATRVPKIIVPRIESILPTLNERNRVKILKENIMQQISCQLCLRECVSIKQSVAKPKLPCKMCHKMFAGKPSLYRHVLTAHSDVYPYKCEKCGSRFKRSDYVTRHTLTCKVIKEESVTDPTHEGSIPN